MKQAFKDMKKCGLNPRIFDRAKLIRTMPETTLRLGLFGL